MSLKFANIVNATASATCAVPGETDPLRFNYRPNALTPRLTAEFEQAQKTGSTTDALINQFIALVSWWDIDVDAPDGTVDAAGAPMQVNLPVTRETIAGMGFGVLKAIMDAVNKDSTVGEARSAT